MKPLYLFLLIIVLTGCGPYYYYNYHSTIQPASSHGNFFESDSLRFQYRLEDKGIHFQLDNKTANGIRINWDEVSVAFNGRSQKVIYAVQDTFRRGVAPITTIPPHSYLDNVLTPADHAIYSRTSTGTSVSVRDVFPAYSISNATALKPNRLKGTTLLVYMPIYFGDNFMAQTVEIRIDSVEQRSKPFKMEGFLK